MNLLIDIGNTRLKWAVMDGLEIVNGIPVCNTDISKEALTHIWESLEIPDQVAIACVASNQILERVSSALKALWPATGIFRAQSETENMGVINAYKEPEKLGIDRWLSMVAAYNKYRKALCVVGCGTAITFDRVDSCGNHLGGLISPGLRLMREALAHGTENLNSTHTLYPFGLADFTDAAIANGTLASACGFIEFMLKNAPENPLLLLTGGDADIIADRLSIRVVIERELVLQGLALTLQNS